MNASLSDLLGDDTAHPFGTALTGVVIGIVTNNNDPDGMGRVKVKFPWLSATDESYWARVATPMAGNGRGLYFLPEPEDEVLVLFERGDVRFPYVIGALWNGKDKAPAGNGDGKNSVRAIKSRSGHLIRFNDAPGKETLEIIDASTGNSIVIDTAANTITITAGKDIVLAAPQGEIKLDAKQVVITAGESASMHARTMTLKAEQGLALQGNGIDLN